MADIPVEKLHELFEYRDGELYWKERPESDFATKRACAICNSKYVGKRVGYITGGPIKYRCAQYRGASVMVHRLIFAMHHGYYPKVIDHIDGNGLNNKIENLRGCDQGSNLCNTKIRSTNKSGYKNINWHRNSNTWQVQIGKNGKKYTKHFRKDELNEAIGYAKELREKLHGEYARHE